MFMCVLPNGTRFVTDNEDECQSHSEVNKHKLITNLFFLFLFFLFFFFFFSFFSFFLFFVFFQITPSHFPLLVFCRLCWSSVPREGPWSRCLSFLSARRRFGFCFIVLGLLFFLFSHFLSPVSYADCVAKGGINTNLLSEADPICVLKDISTQQDCLVSLLLLFLHPTFFRSPFPTQLDPDFIWDTCESLDVDSCTYENFSPGQVTEKGQQYETPATSKIASFPFPPSNRFSLAVLSTYSEPVNLRKSVRIQGDALIWASFAKSLPRVSMQKTLSLQRKAEEVSGLLCCFLGGKQIHHFWFS